MNRVLPSEPPKTRALGLSGDVDCTEGMSIHIVDKNLAGTDIHISDPGHRIARLALLCKQRLSRFHPDHIGFLKATAR